MIRLAALRQLIGSIRYLIKNERSEDTGRLNRTLGFAESNARIRARSCSRTLMSSIEYKRVPLCVNFVQDHRCPTHYRAL